MTKCSHYVLYEKLLVRAQERFPYGFVKVSFFTWLTTRRVILMMKTLTKRMVVSLSWCFLCKIGDIYDGLAFLG